MNKRVYILGAGGFGREILELYFDLGRIDEVDGFLEENTKRDGEIINGKPINDIASLNQFDSLENKPSLIGAIGTPKRKRLIKELKEKGYPFDSIIHPSANVSRWVEIHEGVAITAGVLITCQVRIGSHVLVNQGVHIGHDVTIGDYTTLSPGVEISGNVTIGNEVFIGTNATIIEKISVGDGAIIAAGAVVTEDIPPMALAAGNPAKIKKIYKEYADKPW